MSYDEIRKVVDMVSYKDWRFLARWDDELSACYLQVWFDAEDARTRKPMMCSGRKWLISSFATNSEIISTCLKAVLTAQEHEAREFFQYKGFPIFNPHVDVDALIGLPTDERK